MFLFIRSCCFVFIVFEGIDGCGKTTQSRRLSRWLRDRVGEQGVVATFEPGDWPGGARMREMLLGGDFKSAWSEFFIFMADRCEHVERVVAPALREHRIVVSDRYTPSTIAYQIYGSSGLPADAAGRVSRLPAEIGLPEPDVVVWLDVGVETARERLGSRTKRDSFDARGAEFFRRVRDGYRALSNAPGGSRWVTVDASGDEDDVFAEVAARLEPLLLDMPPCR
jgi:dTMP kinase